jgi:hypothetical protein
MGASAGATVAYAVAALVPDIPSLYFFPHLGVWALHPLLNEPAISWYGWVGYAAMGGSLGALAGGTLLRRVFTWQVVSLAAGAALLLLAWNERGWFSR